jgi:hypothetical protein
MVLKIGRFEEFKGMIKKVKFKLQRYKLTLKDG